MGFLSSLPGVSVATDLIGDVTGSNAAADAAKSAANAQVAAGKEQIGYLRESRDLARQDLMPYTQAGTNLLPFYQMLLNPQNQANYLQNNPMFQAAIEKSNTGFKNTLGFQGKRGDLQNAITQNYMATGQSYVNNALNNLLQPIQMGQSSAAGQANSALTSGQQIGDAMTGIGNARAAGIVGAGNAQANTFNNMLNLGLTGAALMA